MVRGLETLRLSCLYFKIRTEVAPGIELSDLYPKTEIIADVLVTRQRNADGDAVPKTYQILCIKEEDEDDKEGF